MSFSESFKNPIAIGANNINLQNDGVLITRETSINGLFLDASLTENHQAEFEYPSHPVEFGANINDHRIIKPKVFTIRGVVSDFTLHKPKTSFAEGSGETRSQSAWNVLETLASTSEPFNVTTLLKEYRNMQIISLSTTQSVNSSTQVDFIAIIQEILITETTTTELPDSAYEEGKAFEQGSSTKNLGNKQTKSLQDSILNAANTSAQRLLEETQ